MSLLDSGVIRLVSISSRFEIVSEEFVPQFARGTNPAPTGAQKGPPLDWSGGGGAPFYAPAGAPF